jgi:hypothetical protein
VFVIISHFQSIAKGNIVSIAILKTILMKYHWANNVRNPPALPEIAGVAPVLSQEKI